MNGKKTVRILVADDHGVNRQVVARLLEHWGYEVVTASSGREVLSLLESTPIDLVMMDCLMPDMDGFEATLAIRSSDGTRFNPELPIVAITALSATEDRDRCLECGMDDFITKPIVAADLRKRVERVLNESNFRDIPALKSSGEDAEDATDGTGSETLSAILKSMSAVLIRDGLEWHRQLADHCRREEWDQVKMLAHRARGVADLLGDSRLSRLAAQAEKDAASGDGKRIEESVHDFRRELKRMVLDLQVRT